MWEEDIDFYIGVDSATNTAIHNNSITAITYKDDQFIGMLGDISDDFDILMIPSIHWKFKKTKSIASLFPVFFRSSSLISTRVHQAGPCWFQKVHWLEDMPPSESLERQ